MTTHALTRLSSTRFLVVRSFRLQRELLRDPSADCCARGDDRSLDEQGGCVCGVRGRDNGQREVVEREWEMAFHSHTWTKTSDVK